MTLLSERAPAPAPAPSPAPPAPAAPTAAATPAARPMTPRRAALLGVCWLLVALVSLTVAAVGLGALKEGRVQRSELAAFRQQLSFAEAATRSVLGGTDVVPAAGTGSPVALLQVPRLGLQRVVVEGARAGDTQAGPGHVPGTAGLGQPGNAAVVGRRSAYGGAFAHLDRLRPGDPVLVTTVQGQSVYRVTGVRHTGSDVLGRTDDDRLTLTTAAGRGPTGWSRALVVTAALDGKPFPRTPQGTRSAAADGRHGDGSAWATVVVWATLLVLVAAGSAVLYRRWYVRSTYLLTTPALLALVVLCTDAGTRLLPAWV